MKKYIKFAVVILIILIVVAGLGWQWWIEKQSALPEGIASGNGRLSAEEVDIASKFPGRLRDIFVNEGDMVNAGAMVAILDSEEIQAKLDRAQADLAQGLEALKEAQVQLEKAHNDLLYAQNESNRVAGLANKGLASKSLADERLNLRNISRSNVDLAEARLRTLKKGINVYSASVRELEAQMNDTNLKAPVVGRVLYQLAQKGEIIGAGGKVVTLLDLSNVFMEIFLPAYDAAVLQIGSEARIILDIAPNFPIPAQVTFVSPQAQFTPKQVETLSEREKLMFRVKLRIDTELVLKNMERVKTGLRGVGYVRADKSIPWPAFLNAQKNGEK